MKKTILLIGAMVLLLATSCLSNNSTGMSSSATVTGTLIVTETSTGKETYKDDNASVTVLLPSVFSAVMDITYNGIKFADAMPVKLNVTLPSIPYTTTVSTDNPPSKNFVFDVKNVVPTVGAITYDNYKMSRVWGCIGNPTEITFILASKDYTAKFVTKKVDVDSGDNGEDGEKLPDDEPGEEPGEEPGDDVE